MSDREHERGIAMEGKLRQRLAKALAVVDAHGTRGPRLEDDAQHLWGRVQKFISMKLLPTEHDADALELACFGLQLPQTHAAPAVKLGRSNLKQRAEHAAELLVTFFAENATDEALLDRTTRLLHEMPQRQPMIEEARLLADAVNLDDFGLTGVVGLMAQISLSGGGCSQLVDSYEKRDQYGYWDARLKESFHFDLVRDLARNRLVQARSAAAMLLAELKADQP